MSSSEVCSAYREALAALEKLRAAESRATEQELADALKLRRVMHRQLDHDDLRIIDQLDQRRFFLDKQIYPAPAVVSLTRCRKSEAARAVRLAGALFPQTTLDGSPLEPVLPATASAFGALLIDLDHASVIRTVLASSAARRLDPHVWAAAEGKLAEWAQTYGADQLYDMGRCLIAGLDQDGAEPDYELDNQTNELHLTRSADGLGGFIKGHLDSVTFDALVQLIEAFMKEHAASGKTKAERQADALGELCERALDYDDELPETSGHAPHLTVTLDYDKLLAAVRGATLEATGCSIGPGELRRLACTAGIIPAVLGGESEPLDLGRERRHASRYQRRALALRDGGCAFPDCVTVPKWCQAHHIEHWANTHNKGDGGNTDLDNLVLLCRTHHRTIHTSGWMVRMKHGLPEFIPPKWIDPRQTPRQKPRDQLLLKQ